MIEQLPSRRSAGLPDAYARAAERRADSWVNVVTGLGSALVDKVKATVPAPWNHGLPDMVLSDLFCSDATVRKIVCKRPDEALRLGIRCHIPDDAGGHEVSTAIQDAMDDLNFVQTVREACYWENLFGGSVIYLALDDGNYGPESQEIPVNMEGIRQIHWIRAIDRTRIRPSRDIADMDMDATSPWFGKSNIYLLDLNMTGIQTRVHRSRLIIFPGAITTDYERRARDGWGISVIDPLYDQLQQNATSWASAANAIANAQYSVYKLKGLAHMFGRSQGEEQAKARARSMEMAKSLINAVLIDADDEYIRENPNFGNLPAMLDQEMLNLSGSADMPATVLWGRSPAGMNATGESDLELWRSDVDAYREHKIRPPAQTFIEMLMRSKAGPTKGQVHDGWRVFFPSLRQLSEAEKAAIRLQTSQADASDIDKGILLPQEAAVSRFRPEGYSIETQIDLDLREKLLKIEVEQREKEMKEGRAPGMTPPEPEPVPPGSNGNGTPPGKKPAQKAEAA